MNKKYWSKIGEYDEAAHGFTIFSRNLLPNPDGQIEFWVKIVPKNKDRFNRKYDLGADSAFVLHYVTVDCTRKSISLERTGVYDANDNRLGSGSALLAPKIYGGKVKAGSITSEVFESICLRLQ